MAYLEFSDYTRLGFNSVDKAIFNDLLPKATRQLDGLTLDFYKRKHDLQEDLQAEQCVRHYRAEAFQMAIAMTIDFMHESGITSTLELANAETPNVTIGRTHVDATNPFNGMVTSAHGYVVPDEAVQQIVAYGLMYRGI